MMVPKIIQILETIQDRYSQSDDDLEELVTICKCGNKAKFSARIINGKFVTDGAEIAIDGEDNVTYEALCGKCYIEKVMGVDTI